MTHITFRRVTTEQSSIHDEDGDFVGEVFRQPDILNPGKHCYLIWLTEDPRGFARVHERSRIREVARQRLSTHPLL